MAHEHALGICFLFWGYTKGQPCAALILHVRTLSSAAIHTLACQDHAEIKELQGFGSSLAKNSSAGFKYDLQTREPMVSDGYVPESLV